jgi:hypothetical protein
LSASRSARILSTAAVGPDGNLWVCGTTKLVRIT